MQLTHFEIISTKETLMTPLLTNKTLNTWSTNFTWPHLFNLSNVQSSITLSGIFVLFEAFYSQSISEHFNFTRQHKQIHWNFGTIECEMESALVFFKTFSGQFNYILSDPDTITITYAYTPTSTKLILQIKTISNPTLNGNSIYNTLHKKTSCAFITQPSTTLKRNKSFEEQYNLFNKSVQAYPLKVLSTEQIALSFTDVLNDAKISSSFKTFLETNYCSENLLFLLNVDEYKQESSINKRNKLGQSIYKRFINNDSTEAINLADHIHKQISESSIKNAFNINTFDTAYQHIMEMLKFDLWPRFLKKESQMVRQCSTVSVKETRKSIISKFFNFRFT
uniref:RGS domain-containing protein n=1 Tax=Rhabditophanes sp. KR3021 TaxID=114890 RepID=A0AC35TKP2_9BILA